MPPPPLPKSRLSWGKRILLVLGGLAVVVVVTALICFAAWRAKLARSVKEEVAAIQTNGLPVRMADLEHWPADISADQNTALIIQQAFELVGSTNLDHLTDWKLPVRGGVISNKTEMAAALTKYTAAMELIRGITNAASSRYPVQYTDGPYAKLPHLANLKAMSLLFADGASLKADQGDAHAAFEDINASCKLSRSLDNEPILISQLVSSAMFAITTESLERVLARVSLSDQDLLRLRDDFTEAEATNRFWMAMVGERAFDNDMLRMLQEDPRGFVIMANKGASKDEQTDVPIRNPGIGWRTIGFFERDREYFLRAMDKYVSAMAKTPPESLSLTNQLDAIQTQAHDGYYIMSSMFLPSFSGVVSRDADMRARLRTALAATAVERWRIAHNEQIPDSLDELVPTFLSSIPNDPYDGHPLRFKKLAKGYVVYSVGPNGVDDGGKERPPYSRNLTKEERNKFDITFIVER